MNICPQCNSIFTEDFIYCMNDGTPLILDNDDDEQETVIRQNTFASDVKSRIRIGMSVICSSCQVENPSTSKFCNKCGKSLSAVAEPNVGVGFGQIPTDSPTIAFPNSGELPPPNVPIDPHPPQKNNQMKIVLGFVTFFILIFTVWGLANMFGKKNEKAESFTDVESAKSDSDDSSSDSDKDKADEQKSSLPEKFENEYVGKMGGKRLSISLKRDGSNLSGEATTSRTDTLEGTIDDGGKFTLKGYENGTNHTGLYIGKINGDSITGKWTTPYGTKPRSFYLTKQ